MSFTIFKAAQRRREKAEKQKERQILQNELTQCYLRCKYTKQFYKKQKRDIIVPLLCLKVLLSFPTQRLYTFSHHQLLPLFYHNYLKRDNQLALCEN